MSRPPILFLHDRPWTLGFKAASPHCLALEAGFRVFVSSWRGVTVQPGRLWVRGWEVLGPERRRALREPEALEGAVVLHRNMIFGKGAALFRDIAARKAAARLSYHPSWKAVSRKWVLEKALRAAAEAGRAPVSRPKTYLVTPRNAGRVLAAEGAARPLIFKPSAGAMCLGIRLSTPETFPEVLAGVRRSPWHFFAVQPLVEEPALIDGRKFDLRLYALVSSFSPLRWRLYRGGVARLAAEEYKPGAEGLRQLTGCSYRKRRKAPIDNRSVADALAALAEGGVDVSAFWEQAEALLGGVFDAMALRLLGKDLAGRFYLTGVDVLPRVVKGKLELLFLEANYMPQLNAWGPKVDLRAVHGAWLGDLREGLEARA